MVFAFNAALRIGEYVSASVSFSPTEFTLCRSDVQWQDVDNGFAVRIKRSKSDPTFQGQSFTLMNTADVNSPTSLLRRYLAWFDRSFPPNSPLFRRENGEFMVREDIDSVIKRLARLLGLDPEVHSTHGIRYGAAFELAEWYVSRGLPVDWNEIISFGRWSGLSAGKLARHYANWSRRRARNVAEALRTDRPSDGLATVLRRIN